ncbi:hypothetical protein NDU88_003466 [Pleurodeles waltl]|uniref:Uncharacterized protein n=1 Tax=Pleurodeles waltl TaxID=8319 RepID=A0AAV7RDZ8_PLEWA|nr:hypothetical protein NDU88_003466 [Pleurodeles waltl]
MIRAEKARHREPEDLQRASVVEAYPRGRVALFQPAAGSPTTMKNDAERLGDPPSIPAPQSPVKGLAGAPEDPQHTSVTEALPSGRSHTLGIRVRAA